jgi:hypothetical protein
MADGGTQSTQFKWIAGSSAVDHIRRDQPIDDRPLE